MDTIKSVEAFPVAYKEPHYKGADRCITLIRIETKSGAVGWGEALTRFRASALATKVVVQEAFAPIVVGQDPIDVEVVGVVTFGENPEAIAPCPLCKEGSLVIRVGKNSRFVGCSLYPLCEYTEDTCPICRIGIVQRNGDQSKCTNPECKERVRMCPKCGRGWMQKKTRRDGTGTFFGCSDYPTCRHTQKIETAGLSGPAS